MTTLLWRWATLLPLAALGLGAWARAETPRHRVYQSRDQGTTWQEASAGLPRATRVHAFAAIEGIQIAATDAGLFRSTNAARSWGPTASASGAPRPVQSLAVSGSILVAGTLHHGLVRSLDHGVTWSQVVPFSLANIRCLHATQRLVMAGTDAHGVLVSQDGGTTWQARRAGLPEASQVFDLTEFSGTWYAALYSQGLYQWDDQAERWRRLGLEIPLALAATSKALIGGLNPGGILASTNGGRDWTPGTSALVPDLFAFDPAQPSPLPPFAPVWTLKASTQQAWAGAADGLFHSENHGRTWQRAQTGLPPARPAVAFLVTPELLLASVHVLDAAPSQGDAPR
ncbi:MAG: hypothetical protein IT580_15350 [Verrucomicrobiales bacterium]|nr:hypothetical protein [Verrucomicrobiales bacterium]